MKRIVSVLLLCIMLIGSCLPVAADNDSLDTALQTTAAYMLQTVAEPVVGSIGGEWAVIGLARSGYPVPQSYWDAYYQTVEETVLSMNGVLHTKKYTEYSRVILALTAIGADPGNVAGYDLLEPLGDYNQTIFQGLNGPIWALIALDSAAYDMPVNEAAAVQATRQMYIDRILGRQNNDGGWSLTSRGGDNPSDPDMTGMALQALAKYQSQPAVKTATQKGLVCLSDMQDENGGFSSYQTPNSESVVQVIVALCELGIDPLDSRFVKNGHTLVDNLMDYFNPDGSFRHTDDGSGENQMATEQGFYCLAALSRLRHGQNSLYRMGDCTLSVSGNTGLPTLGLPGKHEDVIKVPVLYPGKTFADIAGHENLTAMNALCERGIIDGMTPTAYVPDETMTRAQFSAIVVRGLGLPLLKTDNFKDVDADKWYAEYVGAAFTYGIVEGTTPTTFNPGGNITKQEAALMLTRAAKLCGFETKLESYEVLNLLAPFGDYITASDWAREGLAFCYREGILDESELNIEPKRPVLRCEIAQMVYNLLTAANLM